MAGVYGPDRLPLGDPRVTRLLDQLWPESEEERRTREQRAINDELVTRHIAKWMRETEGLR